MTYVAPLDGDDQEEGGTDRKLPLSRIIRDAVDIGQEERVRKR